MKRFLNTVPLVLAVTALLGLTPAGSADTIKVPAHYPTIQEAIDAAQPGDEVRIKGGLYLEEVVVDGKSDLVIKGSGALLSGGFGGVPLTIRNSSDITLIGVHVADTESEGVLIVDVDGITLQGCSLQNTGGSALRFARCTAVVVRKCKLTNTLGKGIDFGVGTGDGANNVTIEKTLFKNIGDDAIYVNGDTFLITRCKLLNIGQEGIGQSFGSLLSSATITKNKMKNKGPGDDGNEDGAGIQVSGINILIAMNKIRLVHDGPVCISASGMNITIEGNKTTGASTGIEVRSIPNTVATEMYVLNNKVKTPDNTGIEVCVDVLGAVVQGNTVKNSARTGITIWGTASQVIANTVKKAEKYGVSAADGANTFTGNVATGSGECDLYDSESESQTTNIYNGNLFPERCYGS